jgi:hypothetical protein
MDWIHYLIESDLRCLLRTVNIFVECTVSSMFLLLYSGAKLEQVLRDFLICGLEHVDQSI